MLVNPLIFTDSWQYANAMRRNTNIEIEHVGRVQGDVEARGAVGTKLLENILPTATIISSGQAQKSTSLT